jgi:hypothetical protein
MPEEPYVTFDEWWRTNWPRIKDEASISEAQYMSCLSAFQACWDTAVESCAAIVGNAEGVDFGICHTLKNNS